MGSMPAGPPRSTLRRYGGATGPERAARRRTQLLDAALELYGTRGFSGTSVKDICREAALTDRYFYESFRDSRDLFTSLYDHVTAELFARVAEEVAAVPARPRRQARAAIETFVGALAEDRRKARIVFAEPSAAGDEAERHVRTTLNRFSKLVAATAAPHLPADTPSRLVDLGAVSLVGAIERVIIEWQDGHLEAGIQDVTEHLVSLCLAVVDATGVASEWASDGGRDA
jgi:AcrR family transcriptional regulator